MQVSFGGHPYLFVNPRYKGQDIPPSQGAPLGRWFNYGGDKIWPMPEGTKDERHWAGPVSGPLDDGVYQLAVLTQGATCSVRLTGPPDPETGLQYTREVSVGNESPAIFFRAIMKNATDHPIAWSVQSVTQYDLSDAQNPALFNHNFWAYTPVNPRSVYLNKYHVRDGLAGDPSYSVAHGLFSLHWLYLENEVWIDSPAGWVAVVDDSSHYAMVERFHYDPSGKYPGDATVIFYKNGPTMTLNANGTPQLMASNPQDVPYYMETEINSPIVSLNPGETYAMDTEWLPTRMEGSVSDVSDAAITGEPLAVTPSPGGIHLTGSFGVFFAGRLVARLFDQRGVALGEVAVEDVSPLKMVKLDQTIQTPLSTARVSIHLVDTQGKDRGSLGEARMTPENNGND